MKKSSTVLIALALVVALLAGCNSNGYRYVQEDDGGYIILEGLQDESALTGMELQPYILFDSFEEMRNDIISGNFTKEELSELARFYKDEEGRILVCDLNSLHEPIFPENFAYEIEWCGPYYYFIARKDENRVGVVLSTCSKERCDDVARRTNGTWRPSGFEESEVQVTKTRDRNATVYCCEETRRTGIIVTEKHIFYSFDVDGITYTVWEWYDQLTDDLARVTYIYGYSNGYYFHAQISKLSERPSIEWLSRFGVRDRVEAEVS